MSFMDLNKWSDQVNTRWVRGNETRPIAFTIYLMVNLATQAFEDYHVGKSFSLSCYCYYRYYIFWLFFFFAICLIENKNCSPSIRTVVWIYFEIIWGKILAYIADPLKYGITNTSTNERYEKLSLIALYKHTNHIFTFRTIIFRVLLIIFHIHILIKFKVYSIVCYMIISLCFVCNVMYINKYIRADISSYYQYRN